ncbi:MAG: sel1 repeat family protein, partial [Rhizobiaceae bacterium]|nr:sel1 repeat family protein [Rhizobiaceae bacterium]
MGKGRLLLRGAGLVAFLGYAGGVAFLIASWSSLSPQAASERVDALIDAGHTDDEAFRSAIAEIRRFNPSIATYAEGVAAESSQSASATSESALDRAESKYAEAAAIEGPAQSNAMVRLARLQIRRGEANRNPEQTIDLLEKAYALGSSRAGFELGQLYLSGDFVARDRNRAIKYFKEVADGVPEASLALAQFYRDRVATPPSQATVLDLGARAMWQFEERIRQTGATKYMLALANAYDGA